MGSKSKSSQHTTNNTSTVNTTTSNLDNSNLFAEGGSISLRGDNNQITDAKSIAKSFAFAGDTVNSAFAFGTNALGVVERGTNKVIDSIKDNNREFTKGLKDFAESQSTNNDERITKIATYALGGGAALVAASMAAGALSKRKKTA